MTVSAGRKSSGVQWLGSIPTSWDVAPLKHRTTYVSRGRSPDYSDNDSGVPVINQACIYWDGLRLEKVKWQRSETLRGERGALQDGDLLLNSTGTGTLGRATLFREKGRFVADSHVTIVRAGSGTEPRFLNYVLQTEVYQGYIYSVLAPGATNQIELSREGLRNTPFPMPPSETQRAIADFLDRKTGAIDALIAKKKELRALLQERLEFQILRAVTRGLSADATLKDSGFAWIGPIPVNWAMKKLRHVARRVDVGIAEAATHAYAAQGVPLLRSTNVTNGTLTAEDLLFIEPWFAEKNRSKYLRAGDILSVRTGDAGRSMVVPQSLERSQCFTLLMTTLKQGHVPEYYCTYINSRAGMTYFDLESWGTAQKNISVPILASMPAPEPPPEDQLAIARHVGELQSRADALQLGIELQLAKLSEQRQSLITAAVTGQLDIAAQPQEAA